MPSQTIISMNQNYPFGSYPMPKNQKNEILVKKQISNGNKQELIQKAKYLKRLKVPNSIEIMSILQDQGSIQIYYEYVPVKFEIWMKSMSDFLSNNLLKQLYILTTFLAQNKISTIFNPDHLGLDKDYHIKYYLDFQNTFYNEFQIPSTLKQKYYRDINTFSKSFQAHKDIIYSNPMPSVENCMKSQPLSHSIQSIQSLARIFDRSYSFNSLEGDKKVNSYTTEASFPETLQSKGLLKKSATIKPFQLKSINQKFKSIEQKLQIVKQKGPKVFLKPFDFQKRLSLNNLSVKKATGLKRLIQQSKLIEQISIQKLVMSQQRQKCDKKFNKCSQSLKDLFSSSHQIFKPQRKRNKSQKMKSQKNSQSPIEYLDLMKSTSEYVQDFLNVLEDSSESEENGSDNQETTQFQEKEGFDENIKSVLKTQESQTSDENKENKWRIRFDAAIKKSRKLIDRMRSPPKPTDCINKRIK